MKLRSACLMIAGAAIALHTGFWIAAVPRAAAQDPAYEEVTAEDKKLAQRYFDLGKKYALEQNYREAIRQYERALGLYPQWTKAQQALAWAKRDLKRERRGQSADEYTLESLVREARDHYKRGRKYERNSRLLEAAAAFKDAIRLIPGYPEAKDALKRVQSQAQRSLAPLPGGATASSGRAPKAHEPLELSSRTKEFKPPQNRTERTDAPAARRESARITSSRRTDTVASALKTSPARTTKAGKPKKNMSAAIRNHYLIGSQALDHSDYALAIKEFELILEFVPDHRDAQYKLNVAKKRQAMELKTAKRKAEMAKSKGDTLATLTALRDLLNIDPDDDEALAAWEKTKQENKGIITEIYRKGVNAYAKGQYQTALQAWELVLDINPKHAKARESIQKVRQKMELIK